MPKFTFDCELVAAITVEAPDAETAKKWLIDALDCADTNFGAYPNGDPILGEVSLDALDDGPAISLAEDLLPEREHLGNRKPMEGPIDFDLTGPRRIVIAVRGGVAELEDAENWPDGLDLYIVDFDATEADDGVLKINDSACNVSKIEASDAAHLSGHFGKTVAEEWARS